MKYTNSLFKQMWWKWGSSIILAFSICLPGIGLADVAEMPDLIEKCGEPPGSLLLEKKKWEKCLEPHLNAVLLQCATDFILWSFNSELKLSVQQLDLSHAEYEFAGKLVIPLKVPGLQIQFVAFFTKNFSEALAFQKKMLNGQIGSIKTNQLSGNYVDTVMEYLNDLADEEYSVAAGRLGFHYGLRDMVIDLATPYLTELEMAQLGQFDAYNQKYIDETATDPPKVKSKDVLQKLLGCNQQDFIKQQGCRECPIKSLGDLQ
ncbi:MAG: hypothetical protein R3B95_19890 [Nitrospirales bacterium]|nr:hypothetical protein [Nitrospirales bacterium]